MAVIKEKKYKKIDEDVYEEIITLESVNIVSIEQKQNEIDELQARIDELEAEIKEMEKILKEIL